MSTKYVVITAVRDEAEHLAHTIECMLHQSVLPAQWVVVDDGSTDATPRILDEYAAKTPWIVAIHRENRGFRKPGGGVVEAFNQGYRAIAGDDWEFVVKFDGDLSFEPDYFEACFRKFAQEPKLGIGGGTIVNIIGDQQRVEHVPAFHVRGATKIYRRACWELLGGLWPAPGWDTIDEIKANAHGWVTRSFDDLQLLHHRPTGAADGFWPALVKYGRANYICGYHPLFMLSKCLRRLGMKPYIVGSAGILYGYMSGYLKDIPQVDDRFAIRYLRRQQLNLLIGRHSIWSRR